MTERPSRTDAKPSESKIQKDILDYLAKDARCWAVKVVQANFNGCPDILCCFEGRLIGLEVKAPCGKPTALQRHHIAQIKAHGGYATVVYSVAQTRTFLDWVYKEIAK